MDVLSSVASRKRATYFGQSEVCWFTLNGSFRSLTKALEGGGGQFGILVEVVLKVYAASGPFTVGPLIYPGNKLANILNLAKVGA